MILDLETIMKSKNKILKRLSVYLLLLLTELQTYKQKCHCSLQVVGVERTNNG